MKALFTGIYNKFTATPHNTLYTALSGKLYPDEAPQGTVLPYAVYSMPVAVPEYTFTDTEERIRIQFDLYASEHSPACDLYDYCRALFDDCALSVTGYTFQKMERISAQKIKEEFCWRWIVEYHVWLEKN